MMKHGGEEFAPYICMSDIALSDTMGWGAQVGPRGLEGAECVK